MGFFFDERIHHTKCTKNTQKHEKEYDVSNVIPVELPQSPTRNVRKSTKCTKRGTGAKVWEKINLN